MFISLHRILFVLLYFKIGGLLLTTIALKPNSYKLMKRAHWSRQDEYETENNEENWLENSKSAQWPLQAGYPGLAITNLNEYVSLFSHCLVNIQNYQGIEIIGIKSPVYLTRFDVADIKVCTDRAESNSEDYAWYYETHRFFFGKIPPKSEQNCSANYDKAIKYTDKSINARWTCSAQFDLFFPELYEAPQIGAHSQLSGQSDSLFDVAPEYITIQREPTDGWTFIGANPQPTYYLLVHNNNGSKWMRKYWNNHIERLWMNGDDDDEVHHPIRSQTYWMFHLKTNKLRWRSARNTKITPFVSIKSMHFVFPFCPIEVGHIVIPISKESWETEATLLSDFSRFLPLRVHAGAIEGVSLDLDSFVIEFTLRNLISRPKTSLLDRGFVEFIFPNATLYERFYETCFCCWLNLPYNSSLGRIERLKRNRRRIRKYHELPALGIRQTNLQTFMITTDRDEYTFLSCGNTYNDSPDFLALFMPFTTLVWGLIFIAIFGWPLVLSMTEHNFKWKKVLRDFNGLVIGWAMLLEQSHFRATNYNQDRRRPLYCYCGVVLLAIFILSNVYKGDNIRKLTTQPFELVPLTNMAQVKKAGYKTHSIKSCFTFLENFSCEDYFYLEANASRDLAQVIDDKQFKLWEPMDSKVINSSILDILTNVRQLHDSDFDVELFGKCEKDALLGWRSSLAGLEKKLGMKYKSAQIVVGEEFIFSRQYGWQLQRYGSIKVLKRMWSLVESGVYNELRNISYKPRQRKVLEPRPLAINGNISFVFVYHSFALLLALVIVIPKMLKRIAVYFKSISMPQINWFKLFGVDRSMKAVVFG